MAHDSTEGELLPAVPDCELPGWTEIDEDLIDKTVQEINRYYIQRGLDLLLGVGEHVLRTFFGNDYDRFRREGRRHVSFRALAKHPDLALSHVQIWYAVNVTVQFDELPESLAYQLPASHHKLLLPVADRKKKVRLAEKAVKEGLTKRDFQAVVAEARATMPKSSHGGRPRIPEIVKISAQVEKLVERLSVVDLAGESASTLEAICAFEVAEKRLEQLLAAVRNVRSRLASGGEDRVDEVGK